MESANLNKLLSRSASDSGVLPSAINALPGSATSSEHALVRRNSVLYLFNAKADPWTSGQLLFPAALLEDWPKLGITDSRRSSAPFTHCNVPAALVG